LGTKSFGINFKYSKDDGIESRRVALEKLQQFLEDSHQHPARRDMLQHRHAFELAVAALLDNSELNAGKAAEMFATARSMASQAANNLLSSWSQLSALLTGPRQHLMTVRSFMPVSSNIS